MPPCTVITTTQHKHIIPARQYGLQLEEPLHISSSTTTATTAITTSLASALSGPLLLLLLLPELLPLCAGQLAIAAARGRGGGVGPACRWKSVCSRLAKNKSYVCGVNFSIDNFELTK